MKTNKLLYGMLAFAPLAVMLLAFVFMGLMIYTLVSSGPYYPQQFENEWDMPYYAQTYLTAVGAGLMSLVGVVVYALHCNSNIYIPRDKRPMWMVILIFLGSIGMLIYYFNWISKEDKLQPAPIQ